MKIPIHFASQDTFVLGVGWLNKEHYGEGGLELYLGKLIVCFWQRID